MGDIIDKAQQNDELFRQASLEKHFAKTRTGVLPYAPTNCADCGKPIPAKRLKAEPQATRCVDCQGKYERRR
jgi:phage/conjugal plasmid C-4 type zinc finger TraR family protein